jgi:hypothetical protein
MSLSVSDPVKPVVRGARYVLELGEASFEADASPGGRISGLRLGGRNLLTGPEIDQGNYGSTFWTSPQSQWGWPPVPEIDSAPFEASIERDAIVMRGPVSSALGVAVEKRFAGDCARGAFVLEYRIVNRGAASTLLAPWEITRVAPGGLTFYPTGTGVFSPSNLTVREVGGMTWFAYDPALITADQKLFADGAEGWIAHVDGDALFVKGFEPVPRAAHAPGEAQIEIYANPGHTYIEIEAQGALTTIPAGGSLAWRVDWLVRRLPAAIPRSVGSEELVAFVRGLVR